MFSSGDQSCPASEREVSGIARNDEPRPPSPTSGMPRRGARNARRDLQLVHRRLRHRRPEGRQGAAGRALGAFRLGRTAIGTRHTCAYSKHQMRAIVESWRSWRVFSVGRPAGSDDSTATPFHSFVFADRSRPARHRFDSSGAPRLIIPCAHCGVLLIFSHFFPRAPTPSVRCPSLALNSGVSCCPRKAEFNAIVLNEVRVR